MKSAVPRLIVTITCLCGLLMAFPVSAAPKQQWVSGSTALVHSGDTNGLTWLEARGAKRLYDYGAYSLWSVPVASTLNQASSPAGVRQTEAQIDLRGLEIDGLAAVPEPSINSQLRSDPPGEGVDRLWLLQFAGPPAAEWLNELRQNGQQVVTCLQGNACLLWGPPDDDLIGQFGPLVRWSGEFQPEYRLSPGLRPGGADRLTADPVEVTLQFLNVPQAVEALQRLRQLAERVDQPSPVLGYLNVRARVDVEHLDQVAALSPLVNLEAYHSPVMNDELQADILAGTVGLNGSVGSQSRDYIAWLSAAGLPSDPASYPVLDMVDDGVDQGDAANVLHPDFHELGSLSNPDRVAFMNSCLANLSANGVGGHGNLNAGISTGYNAGSAFPFIDANGYHYGVGISPFGRLASTKVFTDRQAWDISNCGNTYTEVVRMAYAAGARLTNNSWGDDQSYSAYDSGAQEYDALVRDADPLTSGNQEMLDVFSAGNQGATGTIGSPGTAKNVLTVGATDFPRTGGSAVNLAYYSSRGPTDDGRAKPDLVAPGSFIQGPASQDPAYALAGGHGAVFADFYPYGQTYYTYSFGTSHAAPAVAGAAQLAYAAYAAGHSSEAPSPAMLKALLINSARTLTGSNLSGNLPNNAQGWGMVDLNGLFYRRQVLLVDQSVVFGSSGEEHTWILPAQTSPGDLRVTLVWTDAPGPTFSQALVNDLDLEVIIDGVAYRGNAFSSGVSTAGGQADTHNNIECVFLPLTHFDALQVRVIATSIGGDGLPGNADLDDQDFALVITSQDGQAIYFPEIGN